MLSIFIYIYSSLRACICLQSYLYLAAAAHSVLVSLSMYAFKVFRSFLDNIRHLRLLYYMSQSASYLVCTFFSGFSGDSENALFIALRISKQFFVAPIEVKLRGIPN